MKQTLYFQESDGIGTVTLDQPGHSANVFNQSFLDELDTLLTELESNTDLIGVAFVSAKPTVFIAGADLHELQHLRDAERIRELAKRGQDLFDRIRALPFPTVALLHGATLGGGAEFALACSFRIASRDQATRIGFPETQLGILPAWGGCTHLPRLIGQAAALKLILSGKPVSAEKARRIQLVDRTCPEQHLERLGRDLLATGRPKHVRPRDTRFPLRTVVSKAALQQTRKKSGGHYPALPEAIAVIQTGLRSGISSGLEAERNALVRLMHSVAFPHLVDLFFLQEAAKKSRTSTSSPIPIAECAVIGAGCMGAGIAQWVSARGKTVILRDLDAKAIGKGLHTVHHLYSKAQQRHILSSVQSRGGRDRVHATLSDTLPADTGLIIEAATERLDVKQALFAELEARTPPETILATNTSSLRLNKIGANMQDPSRLLGLHFFNPVSRMPLVEVVHSPDSDPERTDRLLRFVQDIGKTPVLVLDSPGFVVNRILIPYLMTAGFLMDHGANPLLLDRVMTQWGMPMGPVALMDQIGLAVCGHVLGSFASWNPDRFAVPSLLKWVNEEPDRSLKGFYRRKKGRLIPRGMVKEHRTSTRYTTLDGEQARDWMLAVLLHEALLVHREGLVATAGDVDLAMVMGTGFAPFLGGPLCVGDRMGWQRVLGTMEELAEQDTLFSPEGTLRQFASIGANAYDDNERRAT